MIFQKYANIISLLFQKYANFHNECNYHQVSIFNNLHQMNIYANLEFLICSIFFIQYNLIVIFQKYANCNSRFFQIYANLHNELPTYFGRSFLIASQQDSIVLKLQISILDCF